MIAMFAKNFFNAQRIRYATQDTRVKSSFGFGFAGPTAPSTSGRGSHKGFRFLLVHVLPGRGLTGAIENGGAEHKWHSDQDAYILRSFF